jgi:hypothetical protein
VLLVATGLLTFAGCKSTDTGDGDACSGGACGGEVGGDPLTERFPRWNEAKDLVGDAKAGEDYFYNQMYDSFMTCAGCHSFDADDTMTTDAGEHTRPGVSVWGSANRDNIKGRGSEIAALGGDVCVPYWMGGPEEGMTAQELANLQAFLETGGGADHPTSANIAYKERTYTIPETLAGGDPERGEKMAIKYCVTCHEIGENEPLTGDVGERLSPDKVPTKFLGKLAARIRDQGKKNNEWMPGFPDQRMPEQDLLDILAWFEKKE